jgi:HAE1 family hydrophobic/amphiphilic exporter-1
MNTAKISVSRPIFVTCVVVAIMAFGFFCFSKLPVDYYPDTQMAMVSVATIYPGTGPNEIETMVTKPLEDSISNASGIKKITSKSLESFSLVNVEFNDGIDPKYAEQLVRDKVNQARSKLPQDVKEPVISRLDLSAMPIFIAGLSADMSDAKLYDLADQVIKVKLEQVDKVGSVEVYGGRKREIQILLDQKKLKSREMSVMQVVNSVGSSGQNVPIGKVNRGDMESSFRTIGDYKSIKDISSTMVGLFANEYPTRVSDIGTVVDTVEDERSRMKIDGKSALMFQIYRQSGSNTVNVAEGAKKQLEILKKELAAMPGSPKITVIVDSSEMIKNEVNDVYLTIFLGVLLTILTVYFFLANGRSTLITGLALPISLVGTCCLLYITNCTINIITLLSMSLSVGLLIDDAIVVVENIYRHIEQGKNLRDAVINATGEIQVPVLAISLVVISVFLPMAFMNGVVGQMLRQFGLTVTFSMAVSLFVALTIVPMLTAYFANTTTHAQKAKEHKGSGFHPLVAFGKFQSWLSDIYEKLLGFVVKNPLKILAIAVVVFILSIASFTKVSKNFVPEDDNGVLTINFECAPGTNLDGVQKALDRAEVIAKNHPDTLMVFSQGGSRNEELNKGIMYVKLNEKRSLTTGQFKTWIREQLKSLSYAKPIVQAYDSTGSGYNTPLSINLVGLDAQQLEQYAAKIEGRLKSDPRLKDISSSLSKGKPEMQVILNDEAARLYGISSKAMGYELRGRVEGFTPAKFRENGNEYDVRVRLMPEQRDLKKNFSETYIPNINYRLIKLSDVALGREANTVTSIDRMNRGRYIEITGDMAPGVGLGDVMGSIDKMVKDEIKLPPEIKFLYGGRSDIYLQMISSVLVAFGFAILLVYLILSSLYESFVSPLAILLALPLALCGGFLSLFLTNSSFDMFAIFGMFMLLGVAGKDSILLVAFIRKKMDEGHDLASATISAGKDRLRPILMTSMALIAGAVPIAIGINKASAMRTSMGIVIMGGMISSTLLTLIVVPAAYAYIHRFEEWSNSLFNRLIRKNNRQD